MNPFSNDVVNCGRCGKWILTIEHAADRGSIEDYPATPLFLRVLGDHSVTQVLCPYCGCANFRTMQGVTTNNFIHIMPRTKTDDFGVDLMAPPYAALHGIAVSDTLQGVMNAFRANVERIEGLGSSLALSTGLTSTAALKYQGYPTIGQDNSETPSAELVKHYLSHTVPYWKSDGVDYSKITSEGREQIKVWLLNHKALQVGIETIFSSQIIATWTAIEVLLGDLWEAAVNSHPTILADLSGSAGRIRSTSSDRSRVEREEDKGMSSVRLSEIHRVTRGNFDLRNQMGTLLRRKFSFTALDGARTAYSSAFSKHSKNIDDAMAKVALDAASLSRNVLVHSGGRADAEYVHRAAAASLPTLNLGESFPLRGSICSPIIRTALATSIELIGVVDRWLGSH